MLTCGSLFTGFGGWEVGAIQAGVTPRWGVELDQDIAGVYRQNVGDHIIVGSILDVDPSTLPFVDILFASPPCQAHSIARNKSLGQREDADVGADVVRYVRAIRPRAVLVENVPQYRKADSFAAIVRGLEELGYALAWKVVNAADYGVPQTRKRLILWAFRDLDTVPDWPAAGPWVGWFQAIQDLIPTLPDSHFAPWQLERLPLRLLESFLFPQGNSGATTIRCVTQPASTVTATMGDKGTPRAWLVANHNNGGKEPTIREDGDPMFTVVSRYDKTPLPKAIIVDCQGSGSDIGLTVRQDQDPMYTVTASIYPRRPARAALPDGRVVRMTPRALARFQSFPDSYVLPDRSLLACKGIGNAVPPKLSQTLTSVVVDALSRI